MELICDVAIRKIGFVSDDPLETNMRSVTWRQPIVTKYLEDPPRLEHSQLSRDITSVSPWLS